MKIFNLGYCHYIPKPIHLVWNLLRPSEWNNGPWITKIGRVKKLKLSPGFSIIYPYFPTPFSPLFHKSIKWHLTESKEFASIRPRNIKIQMLQVGPKMLNICHISLIWALGALRLVIHPNLWIPQRALDGTGADFVPPWQWQIPNYPVTWDIREPKNTKVMF